MLCLKLILFLLFYKYIFRNVFYRAIWFSLKKKRTCINFLLTSKRFIWLCLNCLNSVCNLVKKLFVYSSFVHCIYSYIKIFKLKNIVLEIEFMCIWFQVPVAWGGGGSKYVKFCVY